ESEEAKPARRSEQPQKGRYRSRDVTRRTMLEETPNSSELVSCDGLGGYDLSDQAKKRPTNYALMSYSTSSASSLDYEFWTTIKIKTVNDDVWLQALIDGKKVVINEASIRHDLKLNNAEDDLPTDVQDTPILDAPSSSQHQRKHKPGRKQKMETEVEKLEEENKSLIKELKSFNTRVEFLTINETVVDKEESSKQKRKITDIDDVKEVNLENMYNLDMAHKETVLKIAKIIVDEVSTVGGELNAANEKPVSAAPTNITIAQPSEATRTTVDITTAPKTKGIVFHDKEELISKTAFSKSQAKDKGQAKLVEEPKILNSRKAQLALDEEITRMIETKWNAKMKDNIDWNKVVKQVQSRQSDPVRKYQALKTKPVSVAQAKKNMMIYLKIMAGYKMDFFKGMSYEDIRPLF
nr:hypothetical protein [Tanacetum cinerariifolium]